jgi:glycosyltransferase involved in cell wall biosynthesis
MSADPSKVFFTVGATSDAERSGTSRRPLEAQRVVGAFDQPRPLCASFEATKAEVSIIIPARNEEHWLTGTLQSAIEAAREFDSCMGALARPTEIIVVDNGSTDGTWDLLTRFAVEHGIRALRFDSRGAARARNHGRREAQGRILVFVDADTHLPSCAVKQIVANCDLHGKTAGIVRLAALDGGWRARCWWAFWEHVRRLPLPRAKAMPAAMFCTGAVFDEFGPFDEEVAIGEEWPILAGLYRSRAHQFIYDRSLTAYTSSRRMERLSWGYLRTFAKYVWAILDRRGRIEYSDSIR